MLVIGRCRWVSQVLSNQCYEFFDILGYEAAVTRSDFTRCNSFAASNRKFRLISHSRVYYRRLRVKSDIPDITRRIIWQRDKFKMVRRRHCQIAWKAKFCCILTNTYPSLLMKLSICSSFENVRMRRDEFPLYVVVWCICFPLGVNTWFIHGRNLFNINKSLGLVKVVNLILAVFAIACH